MPRDRPAILEILKNASNKGVIIVNVSQCRRGLVTTNYECGSILKELGVIYASDMTVECAMAKLSYLLGKVKLILNFRDTMLKKLNYYSKKT